MENYKILRIQGKKNLHDLDQGKDFLYATLKVLSIKENTDVQCQTVPKRKKVFCSAKMDSVNGLRR